MQLLIGRRMLWAYALCMLIAAIGYARYDAYMMDGDGTAFMDIAQDLHTGHAALAINGYWNPAYPAVLAAAEVLTRPDLWHELVIVRYANVAIFAFAIAACLFFTKSLTKARLLSGGDDHAAVPSGALHLLGLGLLAESLGRELPVAAPRSDTLLLAFLLLAMGLLLRLSTRAGVWAYPCLGLALGCAYLTKSFAFLPSLAIIAGLCAYILVTRHRESNRGSSRLRLLVGVAAVACVFALTAGPYILAISRQLGHLTTGDSARLNYAFFIDNTSRWHEWQHHTLGAGGGIFLHPERLIASPPPVYSFMAHPYGTFPLWFDPAWWTAGLKPHIFLLGHAARLLRNCVVFVRYLLGRPEALVLLAIMLGFGASLPTLRPRRGVRDALWHLAPMTWGLFMLGIYFPIDLQDRYLTGPFLLVLLPLFAALRSRASASGTIQSDPGVARRTTAALVVFFAFLTLAQSGTFLAERRRQTHPAEQRHPGFDHENFPAAAALHQLGLHAGDNIACMGDHACYVDHYWARLAGTQILAEVETPGDANPQAVWDSISDTGRVVAPLKSMGLRYIVAVLPNSTRKPDGWIKLGASDFFAFPLQSPVSPANAEATANLRSQP